jgi:hypothetical protein
MKTIKVYRYSLNHLFILDIENKTRELCYMQRELEFEDKTRITKTTINKHRKDYEKNIGNSFVITSPILANFSDDEEEREYHKKRAENIFVGEYESREDLKQDIRKIYDATQNIRQKHHFVNFASELLDVLNSFITKKILTDKKQIEIAKAIRDEKRRY